MELVVTEGIVRFESPKKGLVKVTAGYKSWLASNNIPTEPVLCDTRQYTAWAMGLDDAQEIAVAASSQLEVDLYPLFKSEPIDLEQIDYNSWVEQKRDWFKREFPHVFRFKESLARENIEVDYPELLIMSGDIWRFAYPQKTATQLVPSSHESMKSLASAYGKDEQWLNKYLRICQPLPASNDDNIGLKAFEKWAETLKNAQGSSEGLNEDISVYYSLHASVYLMETRTLAWLAVGYGEIDVTADKKNELANLLQQEIDTASRCVQQFKQLFAGSYSSNGCDDREQRRLLQTLIEDIHTIAEIERSLQEYEVVKK